MDSYFSIDHSASSAHAEEKLKSYFLSDAVKFFIYFK